MSNVSANPLVELRLENFGPHVDLTINPTSFSVLSAENRSGKSWVLRALSLLLFNECPAVFNTDDSLDEIRTGPPVLPMKARFFRVTGLFADGTMVSRYRDGSLNAYSVQKPGEEKVVYEAVGSGFFEPVGKATGIYPLNLDGKNDFRVNVRLSGDQRYFLIGESGQKQDAILTRLTGVDIIGGAETLAEQEGNSLRRDITEVGKREEQAERETLRLAPAEGAAQAVERGEEMLKVVRVKEAEVERGRELLEKRDKAEGEKEKQGRVRAVASEVGKRLGEVVVRAEQMAGEVVRGEQLLGVKKRDGDLWTQARETNRVASRADLQLGEIVQKVEILCETLASVSAKWNTIGLTRDSIEKAKANAAQYKEESAKAEDAYNQALEEAGVCPICGQKVPQGGSLL